MSMPTLIDEIQQLTHSESIYEIFRLLFSFAAVKLKITTYKLIIV